MKTAECCLKNIRPFRFRYPLTVENLISGVMPVLAWNVVDHGFEPRSGQTEDYKLDLYLLFLH